MNRICGNKKDDFCRYTKHESAPERRGAENERGGRQRAREEGGRERERRGAESERKEETEKIPPPPPPPPDTHISSGEFILSWW